jgi:hypothetical protein
LPTIHENQHSNLDVASQPYQRGDYNSIIYSGARQLGLPARLSVERGVKPQFLNNAASNAEILSYKQSLTNDDALIIHDQQKNIGSSMLSRAKSKD